MNRATLTYAIFFLVFVAGLWAVLTFGSKLRPVDTIQGTWQVAPATPTEPPRQLLVRQSGRYVDVRLPDGRALRMEVEDRTAGDDGEWRTLRLRGSGSEIALTRAPAEEPDTLAATFAVGDQTLTAVRTSADAPMDAGPAGKAGAPAKPDAHPLLTLLVQISIILVAARIMGTLFTKIGQPQVMGEMVAGIVLGPSLFGWLAPETHATLFPADSIRYLNVLSQLGVVLFLFLIGVELDPKLIRNRGHAAVVISHASIIAPFLLGAALVLYLYPHLFNDTREMRFTAVALFMGAAMAITAFPVLARILTERNLHKSKVGAVAITCAAVDDVTAWCMLAFVVAVARNNGLQGAIITATASLIYVLAMFFLVRPFLGRLQAIFERQGHLSRNVLAVILLLVLVSAYTTERIGIHALFGAFLMGAIMPKGTGFVRTLSEKLEDFTVVFLLPIFFAFTGLKTQIGLIDNAELWWDTALIIAVACLGKFGGSSVAALSCGMSWRESGAIGILMNTRGLMELVILNIGRELGVITDAVFAMMVLMALTTTALTTPVLNWIYPARLLRREKPPREAPSPGTRTVLIPVALPKSGEPLVRLADLLAGPRNLNRRIAALYLRRPVEHEAYRDIDDEIEPETLPPLQPLLAEAQRRDIDVESISFVSKDIAGDIVRVSEDHQVDLILMGFHKPVIGNTVLGGTVHWVLTGAGRDVAIFVDRGLHDLRSVLVPYMGGPHDRFAMEIGQTLARNGKAQVTILHIVPPGRSQGSPELGAKQEMERVFQEKGIEGGVTFRVVENHSPVDAVLGEAHRFDLVVVGVEEGWGLESHLFGWRSERIARDCPSSLLIVLKGAKRAYSTDHGPMPSVPAPAPAP